MKQVLSALILIAVVASLLAGGTLARWIESDFGASSFEAGEWHVDCERTIGWYKNWDNHLHLYPNLEDDINYCLNAMNPPVTEWYSCWLMPNMDVYPAINTADMVELINQKDESRKAMFLAQYLVQRLNQMLDAQSEDSRHNVMLVPTYKKYYQDYGDDYLDLSDRTDAPGWEILQKIEAKCGGPELGDENADEFVVMKDVCDWLNNLGH